MRRLLVYCARVGDLVILTPMMRQLAQDAELTLLARPWAVPLLADQPWLARIHTLADPNAGSLTELLRGSPRAALARKLAGGFDEIVAFQGEGARLRTWLTRWAGTAPIRWISFRNDAGVAHRVAAGRLALERAGLPTAGYDGLPQLDLPAAELAAARHKLARLGQRVLAVQAGSSLTHRWLRRRPNLKGLAPQQWADLIAGILQRGEADAAVLHGSAPEGREARAILAALPSALRDRVEAWTGLVPLRELRSVLAQSQACLSVDTGPAHIAAAVGCPLLVVFGPTDPAVFAPTGRGPVEILLGKAPCQFCHGTPRMAACRSNACLTGLSAATIQAAWQRLHARCAALTKDSEPAHAHRES